MYRLKVIPTFGEWGMVDRVSGAASCLRSAILDFSLLSLLHGRFAKCGQHEMDSLCSGATKVLRQSVKCSWASEVGMDGWFNEIASTEVTYVARIPLPVSLPGLCFQEVQ
jgi:hypothetical protein